LTRLTICRHGFIAHLAITFVICGQAMMATRLQRIWLLEHWSYTWSSWYAFQ